MANSISFNTILADWQRGRFDPVYLFYGEEDFLIEQLCDQAVQHLLAPGEADFNLNIFYAGEVDGTKIVQITTSFPMMASCRLVIVRNLHLLAPAGVDLLTKYAQAPLASTCLIMTAEKLDGKKSKLGTLSKHCTNYEAKPLYDNAIPEWLRKHLANYALQIEEDAIRLLQGSTGASLRNLAMEIDKIRLNMGERNKIIVQDVEQVVGMSKQFSVFELCDAIGYRKQGFAHTILTQMLQHGEAPGTLVSMISRHFFILARLREMKLHRTPEAEMARALRVHPFFLGNYAKQASLFNSAQIHCAFEHLRDADQQLKSSYQKPRLVLELLLFKLQYLCK